LSDLRPTVIEPLAEADGGGFVAFVPDLPGCMSDGETPGTSSPMSSGAWIEAAHDLGHEIPEGSKRWLRSQRKTARSQPRGGFRK
jgi:hypothetical protein